MKNKELDSTIEKLIELVRNGVLFIYDPDRKVRLQNEAIELICRDQDQIRINLRPNEK